MMMNRPLTGRDAAALLFGFFAVVIGVNTVMARLAGSTFGGALAENGYVASQDYNGWIRAAAAQDRLGWTIDARVEGGRLVVRTNGVGGAAMAVTAVHPLGREEDRTVAMTEVAPGTYRSLRPLAPGRWQLHIRMTRDGHEARFIREARG